MSRNAILAPSIAAAAVLALSAFHGTGPPFSIKPSAEPPIAAIPAYGPKSPRGPRNSMGTTNDRKAREHAIRGKKPTQYRHQNR